MNGGVQSLEPMVGGGRDSHPYFYSPFGSYRMKEMREYSKI
jgi:hypothetical protein